MLSRLAVFFCLISWGCVPASESGKNRTFTFYDINGLIDEQIRLLDSISPVLYKEAIINGSKEEKLLHDLDSATLADELGIFKAADINLPTLSDRYFVEEKSTEDNEMLIYRSKFPNQSEVDSLHVTLTKAMHPLVIEAHLSSTNALYNSQKKFQLYFTIVGRKSLLEKYAMYGWQKMTTRDFTTFALEGEITFP